MHMHDWLHGGICSICGYVIPLYDQESIDRINEEASSRAGDEG